MCDTLVAVGQATTDGSVILAKNSDREPNEAQNLTHVPAARHEAGSRLTCTYLEIPQVAETYEVLLSRPFWMWGAEMGVNAHGVAIGNEAVFTREPYSKRGGLTGMDMLRLALERAASAQAALEVLVALLADHGQGGNCGYRHKLYYHNAFIIADPGEAWVLETAGSYWAAERVRSTRSISNGLTIGEQWDLASSGLVEHARAKGWCTQGETFSFARCYGDRLYTPLDGCRIRQTRSTQLLSQQSPRIDPASMMTTLRDHGEMGNTDPNWTPDRGWTMETLCAHASLGPLRNSQTTGSLVAHLTAQDPTIWATGTATPCTGLFKPLYLGARIPDLRPASQGTFQPSTLWWEHERLHRAVLADYATRLPVFRDQRDRLEGQFIAESQSERRSSELSTYSAACFRRAAEATRDWTEAVLATPVEQSPPFYHDLAWARHDRQAQMPDPR